jgi:hypothetical protein
MAKSGILVATIAGIALVAAGVALVVMGYQEYTTLSAKLSRAVGQAPSNKALGYFVSGAVCVAGGLASILKRK